MVDNKDKTFKDMTMEEKLTTVFAAIVYLDDKINMMREAITEGFMSKAASQNN